MVETVAETTPLGQSGDRQIARIYRGFRVVADGNVDAMRGILQVLPPNGNITTGTK